MALSTKQVLLLNNLMYTYNSKAPDAAIQSGVSVGDFVNSMNPADYAGPNDFMTTQDWQEIVTAVKSDPVLMRMEIASAGTYTSGDPSSNAFSAVFIDRTTQEAVVAYKGTQGDYEWRDNFRGGSTADTPCQEAALRQYQQLYKECGLEDYNVTVTGHSKGGNKAKYITLMDSTVDRCLSFDGQGFSDEFFEAHADRIAQRQHLIENHNVDGDYVNILLNDVGARHYYKAQNLGNGGNAFHENHCPNSFFRVGENGEVIMTEGPQSGLMAKADELFNGMLRAMPSAAMKEAELALVGELVIAALNGEKSVGFYTSLLFSPENADCVAFFVTYVREYGKHELLETLLEQFGLEGMMPVVDTMLNVLDSLQIIPGWVLALGISGICWFLEKILGIDLPNELLVALITTHVTVTDGSDKKIASRITDVRIRTDSTVLSDAAGKLAACAASAADTAQKLAGVKPNATLGALFGLRISGEKDCVNTEAEDVRRLETALRDIAGQYATAERAITASAG